MQSRWMTTLSIATLFLVQTHLTGWGSNRDPRFDDDENTETGPSATELHFPMNDNQNWFMKESYLLWVPHEDDIDYGIYINFDPDTTTVKTHLKKPDFEWSSGVRVGVGAYVPKHEFWDVSAFTTYYYNQADSSARPALEENKGLDPLWNIALLGTAFRSKVETSMNFFIFDLATGRKFGLTPWLNIHPFVGVRGALLYQRYKNRNTSNFFSPSSDLPSGLGRSGFKAKNEFYGVGPRIGTDLTFALGSGWSLVGNLSASFLWSHYEISERFFGNIFAATNTLGTVLTPMKMKAHDAAQGLKTNLEGSFGIEWEKWSREHKIRFAPSILFEASEWFSINHWFDTTFALTPNFFSGELTGIRAHRHAGDLGFIGLTVNLQVDY